MIVPARRPRVLLVGAYERDNVGDLLFLLVTERYLDGAEVVASAPFAADMTPLLDREIPAYGPLLDRAAFDVVWTVGGQVGAIDLRRAYRLSAPPHDYRRYQRASERRRAGMLRRATGGAGVLAPYLPDARAHPGSAGALTIVNSAGLSGIRGQEPERRERLVAQLRRTDAIAVRDRPSGRYLADLGIEHALVPDAVHAVGRLWPGARDPRSDVAVVQVSSGILATLGHAELAAALAGSPALAGLRIRLLLAGTATGHDRVEDLAEVAGLLRRATPGADVALLEGRRPRAIVEQIRRARVVIGTSLHVRIIAAAYGVPRVSLARRKVAQYAQTWDPVMPYGVTLAGLDGAVSGALAAADEPAEIARAAALGERAHEHLAGLAERVAGRGAAAVAAVGC